MRSPVQFGIVAPKNMKKKKDKCQVKGCRRKAKFVFMSHDLEDKEICKKCADKYFKGK